TMTRMAEDARVAGLGSVGNLIDAGWAGTDGKTVTRTDARLRISGPDRYRVDYLRRADRSGLQVNASDGERYWRVFPDRILTGPAGPLTYFPADVIVDAETGCLLRLISYIGDAPSAWWELDEFSTEPVDPDDFRVDVPPGTRVVEETGNLIADAVAAIPGAKGTAARAAVEAVNRTAGAVSAARSFLDDLRGHR